MNRDRGLVAAAALSRRPADARADRRRHAVAERLPVDAYPDLSPPMVEIITQWPGHAAEEVERLITVPVEVGMNGIPADDHAALDLALRLVGRHPHFRDGTDNYFARQQVFNRLSSLSLPTA
jgi:cobalt-zinc-cadmium resistance protein CzcA